MMIEGILLLSLNLLSIVIFSLNYEITYFTPRIILGLHSAALTEVYAELDPQKALEAIVRVG